MLILSLLAAGFILILAQIQFKYRPMAAGPAVGQMRSGSSDEAAPKAPEEVNKPRPAAEPTASFIAVGDIMLSRNVAAKMKKYRDVNYPFASTTAFLNSADFAFANLEAPITAGPVVPTGSFTFHADPGAETALAAANFKILSLANNHLPNYGREGIADTLKYLSQAGIASAGAGLDEAAAYAPAFIEARGYKFAFLAENDSDVVPPAYGASAARAGTALIDLAKMKRAVAEANERADFVIVSMHSGKEYTEELTEAQTGFARAAIDAGADLVIGHHPHVVQRVEKYKGKYIFYSLGNFVFDQMWSEDTRRGVAARFIFGRGGVERINLTAVLIEDYARPRPLTGPAAEAVFKRLRVSADDKIIEFKEASMEKFK